MGKDSPTLLCMLNLQEIRLIEWAERAGLMKKDGVLDPRLNQRMIQAILERLGNLLLDADKLKARYKMALVPRSLTEDVCDRDRRAQDEVGLLDSAMLNNTRRDILYRARLITSKNNFPRRLWWAAVDKSRLEELIKTIRDFVQDLWDLLDARHQDDMLDQLQVVLSHVISTNRKVEDLQSLSKALIELDTQGKLLTLADVAGIKAVDLSTGECSTAENSSSPLSQTTAGMSYDSVSMVNMDALDSFVPLKISPDKGLARLDGRGVFVEWKSLPRQNRGKILKRTETLAALLHIPKHANFRSLNCIGLARDNDGDRIAFIYDMPASSDQSAPKALRQMFGNKPSVTERLQLALRITDSVKYFHTAGWLHKNLRSENILFFRAKKEAYIEPSGLGLAEPILAGFAFSRVNSSTEISEQPLANITHDIYRHPDAMGEPTESYDMTKDIYALGLILLEIGEWRSLKSLLEGVVDLNKPDITVADLARIRPFVLDDGPKGGLGSLGFRMGEIYAKVTKAMLSGAFAARRTDVKATGDFYEPSLLEMASSELRRCVI